MASSPVAFFTFVAALFVLITKVSQSNSNPMPMQTFNNSLQYLNDSADLGGDNGSDYDYNYYENDFAGDWDGIVENDDDVKNQYFVKIPKLNYSYTNTTTNTLAHSSASIDQNNLGDPEVETVMNFDDDNDENEDVDVDLESASTSSTSIPGIPGEDYPTYHEIPKTSFLCSEQRYKGFFADVDAKCQAWHYCDFQENQKTFLCPNGTIFSQIQLTCDWWFNVNCNESQQLYVLNERLYRFIKPPTPKFPEDFHGPDADLWLIQQYKQGLLPKTRKVSNSSSNETKVN